MNTSQFMDKQIMDLSRSKSHSDFIDLMNPTDDNGGVRKTEEILPSYDFQPIRPIGDSQSPNLDERKDWTSLEPKTSAASIRVRLLSLLIGVI